MHALLSFIVTTVEVEGGFAALPPRMNNLFRLSRIAIVAAIAIFVAGGVEFSSSNVSDQKLGASLEKAGALLFVAVFVFLTFATCFLLRQASYLQSRSRYLLIGCLCAVPFFAIRLIYACLDTFNLNYSGSEGHTDDFNPLYGEWVIYLVMVVIMQFVVVVIYGVTGMMIQKELKKTESAATSQNKPTDIEMSGQRY